jgi:hypothetical protein
MESAMTVRATTSDAQMLKGAGRYLINTDVALVHIQILQCRAAGEIKKGFVSGYTCKVYCPEMWRGKMCAVQVVV